MKIHPYMKTHRNKLILTAFLLQILMLLSVIALVYGVSRKGQTVILEMTGYDPYDALRGRYLQMDNPDDDVILEPGSLERYIDMNRDNVPVYVVLEENPENGLSSFSYASLDRPGDTVPYIRCGSRYLRTYEDEPRIRIIPRINQYYLNENSADRLDQSVRWDTEIHMSLKIWHGLYVVDGIEIDGQRY